MAGLVIVYPNSQTEHFDVERRSVETLKTIADSRGTDELAPYLLAIYYKIINNCLVKHSKRSPISKVSCSNTATGTQVLLVSGSWMHFLVSKKTAFPTEEK